MNLYCLSDIHGNMPPRLPKGKDIDTVLISGDLVNGFTQRGAVARAWLSGPFSKWADEAPVKNVIVTPGNHDFWSMESNWPLPTMSEKVTLLNDSGVEIDGVKFWGTPWQPPFGWAYNVEDKYAHEYYDLIPDDTQVLLSHSPPFGYSDEVLGGKPRPAGSRPLLAAILEGLPDLELVVCGHIHSGHGVSRIPDGPVVINAAVVNEDYQIARMGRYFEV